jgi:ATP-dependent helicase HrpA
LGSRNGLLRLLRLNNSQQVKYLRKQMLRGNDFNLALAGAQVERVELVDDLIDAAYVQAMNIDGFVPRSETAFAEMQSQGNGDVIACANALETILMNTLPVKARLRRKLAEIAAGQWPDTRADIDRQLLQLFDSGFLRDTPLEWLSQYPRYLKALENRIDRLSGQYSKDQKQLELLAELGSPLWSLQQRRPGLYLECPQAAQYRWMLEELRVSLFAQSLGTRMPVSEKRLRERWPAVERWNRENPH